jgi:hypothetical protein
MTSNGSKSSPQASEGTKNMESPSLSPGAPSVRASTV